MLSQKAWAPQAPRSKAKDMGEVSPSSRVHEEVQKAVCTLGTTTPLHPVNMPLLLSVHPGKLYQCASRH